MLRKTTTLALLAAASVSLSGCSTMWSGVSSFSDYMAEKTEWVKLPSLRGSKKVQTAEFTPETSETDMSAYSVEMYDSSETTITTYDAPVMTVDSGDVPCPSGTYLTAENSCMILDEETYQFSTPQ